MARGHQEVFNIEQFRAGYVAWGADIRADVIDAVEQTAREGEQSMQQTIVSETTPTGDARAARGDGIAGRVESGRMYNEVRHTVEVEGDEIVGRWGWTEENEEYFEFQNDGTRFVEGMNALGNSFEVARDRMGARLRIVGRR